MDVIALSAVVQLDFDPFLHLRGPVTVDVRWETLGIAAAVFLALLVAARFARRSGRRTGLDPLRLDDLLYIAVGVLPGAAVGGRLVQVLDYLDFYRANPGFVLDPAHGSLSLLGAVVGGTLSGAYLASLLEGAPRRWMDVASVSLLLVIGLGKVAQFAAGGGQGAAWDGPWAVAFTGAGPWLSAAAQMPSHPAQLYEAAWALLGIPVVFALHAGPVLRRLPARLRQEGRWAEVREAVGREVARGRLRFGYLYAFALGWWLVGRIVIATTWRDDPILGPLRAEQVAGLVVLAAVVLLVLLGALRQPRIADETRWREGYRRWRLRRDAPRDT